MPLISIQSLQLGGPVGNILSCRDAVLLIWSGPTFSFLWSNTQTSLLSLEPEAPRPVGQPWGKSNPQTKPNLRLSGQSSPRKSGKAAHLASARALSPNHSQRAAGSEQRQRPFSSKPAPCGGSHGRATGQVIKLLPLAEGRLVACRYQGGEQQRSPQSPLLRLLWFRVGK